MESLTTKVILQHLSLDKQKELLTSLLTKDNELQTVYTVYTYSSYPTGGDWCDHSSIELITGNYKEAKEYYDKKANQYLDNVIPDDDRCPSVDEYTLFHGSTKLEEVNFDFGNLTVYRKIDENNIEYPNYELIYPLYLIKFVGNYDIIYYDGPYQNYNDALIRYVSKVLKMDRAPTGWSKDTLTVFELYLKDNKKYENVIMHFEKKGMTDDDFRQDDNEEEIVDI